MNISGYGAHSNDVHMYVGAKTTRLKVKSIGNLERKTPNIFISLSYSISFQSNILFSLL